MASDVEIQRLALIKYMFNSALDQSNQPEPLCGLSILTFHDCIELFLHLALEKLTNQTKDHQFLQYWDLISRKLGRSLTGREEMERLNKSRVNFKHHGILPSTLDVEGYRSSCMNFFNENTNPIFGIDFESISLINLVKYPDVQSMLQTAEKMMGEGNLQESMNAIGTAFQIMINSYMKRKTTNSGRSPFFFCEPMKFASGHSLSKPDNDLKRFVDITRKSIDSMQEALKIISLGLDFRRYVKFDYLTPFVSQAASGKYVIDIDSRNSPITIEDCEFCINFVIDSALKLQEFDFNTKLGEKIINKVDSHHHPD